MMLEPDQYEKYEEQHAILSYEIYRLSTGMSGKCLP
jgi:hypothetical protein